VNPEYNETETQIRDNILQRYVSFLAFHDAVVKIMPIKTRAVILGQTQAKMYTNGGLFLGAFQIPSALLDDENQSTGDDSRGVFTCATLLQPSQGGLLTAENLLPTHMVTGTSTKSTLLFDINRFGDDPVLTYDVSAPAVVTCAGGGTLGVGCSDGKIRFLDARLRSAGVINTLDAHSGPLSDITLHSDEVTLASCG